MNSKVILVLCDGMRSDSVSACGHPLVPWVLENGSVTLNARTIMPSITIASLMGVAPSPLWEGKALL